MIWFFMFPNMVSIWYPQNHPTMVTLSMGTYYQFENQWYYVVVHYIIIITYYNYKLSLSMLGYSHFRKLQYFHVLMFEDGSSVPHLFFVVSKKPVASASFEFFDPHCHRHSNRHQGWIAAKMPPARRESWRWREGCFSVVMFNAQHR